MGSEAAVVEAVEAPVVLRAAMAEVDVVVVVEAKAKESVVVGRLGPA